MFNPQLQFESGEFNDVSSVLSQPNLFLPALAEAVQDELAFYCQDMRGRFTYLSKSAEIILNHNPQELLNRHVSDILTDDPSSIPLQASDRPVTNQSALTSCTCETINRDGDRRKLKYWRVPVMHNGIQIGLAGVICRLREQALEDSDSEVLSESEETVLLSKVESLSPVESEVIEMVVNGQMNKEIAALLRVAVRTIESRRARAMAKLNTKNLSELVQLWVQLRRIKARNAKSPLPPAPNQL